MIRELLHRLARFLGMPVRAFFNPRFEAVVAGNQAIELQVRQLDGIDDLVTDLGDTTLESHAVFGRRLDAAVTMLERLSSETAVASEHLDHILRHVGYIGSAPLSSALLNPDDTGTLSQSLAELFAWETSWLGFAGHQGLWFNNPVSVAYASGRVSLGSVNERIAEVPFAFQALSAVAAGSRILDVGSTESTVALSLATLGHRVTAVDPRPYPLRHPNLTVVTGTIEDLSFSDPFDAAVLLSTIEHIGVGAYSVPAADKADLDAMRRVRELVRPGGTLVLTTPYGPAAINELERTYDDDAVEALLVGWTVLERLYLRRDGATQWTLEGPVAGDEPAARVVCIRAERGG